MTPSEYEKLFAEIVEGIRARDRRFEQLTIGSGNNNRIRGASGYKHQIDVSIDLPATKTLYLVECKRWKRKIGVQEMLVLASRTNDIHNDRKEILVKPIIASQVGATPNAQLIAQWFDIQIDNVESAYEYGLQLGQSIFLALSEHVGVSDEVSVTVYPKREGRGEH